MAIVAWTVQRSVSAVISNSNYLQDGMRAKHEQIERMQSESYDASQRFTKSINDINSHIIPQVSRIDKKTDRLVKNLKHE